MTVIAVVSDTHCLDWSEVHPDIKAALADADIAVHCGDFTRMSIVDGVRACSKRAVLVHGNSDPVEIRSAIPYVEVYNELLGLTKEEVEALEADGVI